MKKTQISNKVSINIEPVTRLFFNLDIKVISKSFVNSRLQPLMFINYILITAKYICVKTFICNQSKNKKLRCLCDYML